MGRTILMMAAAAVLAGPVLAQTAPAPVALETLATLPAEPLLIEGVARDASGALILSSVNRGRLYRVQAGGVPTLFGDLENDGLYGLAADPERGLIYVASSARPGGAATTDAVLFALTSDAGAVEGAWRLTGGPHAFGDVAVASDGRVFVSDSKAGLILMLRPWQALQTIARLPEGGSPQGLAISADGHWLVFSDYRTGLHRIDLTAPALTRDQVGDLPIEPLTAPEGAELRGIDGLARHGDAIIAVQNGTPTPRILRLTLNADWSAVTAREALIEGPPLSEPTTGFVEGDSFVFVSRSQWTDFDPSGHPSSESPAPAVISRLPL